MAALTTSPQANALRIPQTARGSSGPVEAGGMGPIRQLPGPFDPNGPPAGGGAIPTSSVSVSTPVNPMQSESYDAARDYSNSLRNGTNEMITREIGRARDEISVGMAREGEEAIARGADPSLFRTRALASGKRDIHALQGRLADVSLGRQAEGIGLQTNAAQAAASEQRLLNLGTASQRLNEDRAMVERAEAQARLNQAPYDRLMQMMSRFGGGGSLTGSGSRSGLFGRSGF